MEPRLKLF